MHSDERHQRCNPNLDLATRRRGCQLHIPDSHLLGQQALCDLEARTHKPADVRKRNTGELTLHPKVWAAAPHSRVASRGHDLATVPPKWSVRSCGSSRQGKQVPSDGHGGPRKTVPRERDAAQKRMSSLTIEKHNIGATEAARCCQSPQQPAPRPGPPFGLAGAERPCNPHLPAPPGGQGEGTDRCGEPQVVSGNAPATSWLSCRVLRP